MVGEKVVYICIVTTKYGDDYFIGTTEDAAFQQMAENWDFSVDNVACEVCDQDGGFNDDFGEWVDCDACDGEGYVEEKWPSTHKEVNEWFERQQDTVGYSIEGPYPVRGQRGLGGIEWH